MKPHKHKDLIIAWANGALIEYRQGNVWLPTASPWWEESIDYRIEPKPDFVMYAEATPNHIAGPADNRYTGDNLRLTFDGETGKLKAAEVLNG
jgi:hypothetical protein